MKIKKDSSTFLFCGFILLLVFLANGEIYAKKNGISGKTSQITPGCNCHSQTSSKEVNITVISKSGTFTVEPGKSEMFSVTLGHPLLPFAGIGLAVKTTENGEENAGTLSIITGEGLQLQDGELVHTSPKSLSKGLVTFVFNWTAPTTPGKYYLRVIGNAVNGNNSADANDKWNWMAPLAITVEKGNSISDTDIQNFISPNPFKEFANINLSKFAYKGIQRISIFDASGNELRQFDNSKLIFSWDGKDYSGRNVSAGVYFLVVRFSDGQKVIPLISL
jgi:hypothetical protein